jgi:4a-hydroxytetrahydrobiopterin dehydratase
MVDLAEMRCVPCKGDEPTVTDEEMRGYRKEVPEWKVIEREGVKHLERQFKFKDFSEALDFTIEVGDLAEEEDHHPVITTEWGKVKVTWWTHAIGGLHRNDFIMAAKTDELYE